MPSEMGHETVEILTMAMDKFLATKNYEVRRKNALNSNDQIHVRIFNRTKYLYHPLRVTIHFRHVRLHLNLSRRRWIRNLGLRGNALLGKVLDSK